MGQPTMPIQPSVVCNNPCIYIDYEDGDY